jgi:anaphase-promoting complex subunit 1
MVNTIAQRTLAVTVGQGIFEYGTRRATITDTWPVPLIELSTKIIPSNSTIRAQIGADHADWPCFHNGVSAALSISPDSNGIDSSWIMFNRPREPTAEHGGFLLGMGLTGHLKVLLPYHALSYLDLRNDYYSTGVLLGLACSYAGSEDLLITKVLSLHTHALLPLGSMELNASPVIQSSALVGLGLVFAGSKNLRMAEVALSEVGRMSMVGVETFMDYAESYSFSAAMAFGLIMLGRGGQTSSEVDRRLLAQLQRCINGDAPRLSSSKSTFTNTIDLNLTAPGATLALGLMYLKTNRSDIRDMLSIPQTPLAMEHVAPELLLVHTLARGLIMWEEVSPTMGWIEDQLPPFVFAAHKGHKRVSGADLATELAYINIVAGACFAIGLKYAGTASELAHNNLVTFYGVLTKTAGGSSMTYEGKIRRTAARQALAVVTLALCMIMSGTGELNVLRRLRISHGQEGNGVTYGTHMAMHMALGILFLGRGNYTLGNSNLAIAALAIACFPRFSPTPDDNKAYPQAFRHLWALAVEPRCLMARDVDSGEVVYLPVKIRWKDTSSEHFGESSEPVRPRSQNLISPTLIAPFDKLVSIEVDSVRYWPIAYDLSNSRDRSALIRTRTIHVKRKSGFLDYNSDPKGNRSIFVRAGSMTGFDMHYDLVSEAKPPALTSDEVLELVKAHSVEPVHTALARYFTVEDEGARVDAFVRTVLLECVTLDKPALIGVYLGLLLASNQQTRIAMGTKGQLGSDAMAIESSRELGMVRSFFSISEKWFSSGNGGEGKAEKRPPLIRPSFLSAIARNRNGHHESDTLEAGVKAEYLRRGRWDGDQNPRSLAAWLEKTRVPPLPLLRELAQRVALAGQGLRPGLDMRLLELRVRDAAERYRAELVRQYDLDRAEEGLGVSGSGWKAASVGEAVRIWLGRM